MTTTSHNFDRLDELAAAQVEGDISSAEFAELETLLGNAVSRRRYLDYLVLHGEMLWEAARSEESRDTLQESGSKSPFDNRQSGTDRFRGPGSRLAFGWWNDTATLALWRKPPTRTPPPFGRGARLARDCRTCSSWS